ncbi:hypothetical protein PVL29_011555 [Vitis rotundifolia]|uniref:Uncharacterized protein n=1 Tax=Vitis rotundifolia TaxID=103349 RepID=A0AA38ZQI0_VITRO|nr:hypothetical protein PVL29_011555 [Vitis rotundifolia]
MSPMNKLTSPSFSHFLPLLVALLNTDPSMHGHPHSSHYLPRSSYPSSNSYTILSYPPKLISFPSAIPSYQLSPSSSNLSFIDANAFLNLLPFLYESISSSLSPLRISNSAPVTPLISSLTSRVPMPKPNWESLAKESMASIHHHYPIFAASAPVSPPRCQYIAPTTILECEKSDISTVELGQWVSFQVFARHLAPSPPTFNLMKSVA